MNAPVAGSALLAELVSAFLRVGQEGVHCGGGCRRSASRLVLEEMLKSILASHALTLGLVLAHHAELAAQNFCHRVERRLVHVAEGLDVGVVILVYLLDVVEQLLDDVRTTLLAELGKLVARSITS